MKKLISETFHRKFLLSEKRKETSKCKKNVPNEKGRNVGGVTFVTDQTKVELQ
jgi:hypothetical protein